MDSFKQHHVAPLTHPVKFEARHTYGSGLSRKANETSFNVSLVPKIAQSGRNVKKPIETITLLFFRTYTYVYIYIIYIYNHMHNAFGRENPPSNLTNCLKIPWLVFFWPRCPTVFSSTPELSTPHKLTMNWSPATSGHLMIPRSCMKNILKHGLFVVHCPFETMNDLTQMKVAGNQIQSISFEICSQIICSDI